MRMCIAEVSKRFLRHMEHFKLAYNYFLQIWSKHLTLLYFITLSMRGLWQGLCLRLMTSHNIANFNKLSFLNCWSILEYWLIILHKKILVVIPILPSGNSVMFPSGILSWILYQGFPSEMGISEFISLNCTSVQNPIMDSVLNYVPIREFPNSRDIPVREFSISSVLWV